MNSEEYIDSLFKKAGWFPNREIEVEQNSIDELTSAHANAIEILKEFSGLSVGEVGAGRDASASDICFRKNTFSFSSEFHNHWPSLNKELYAIATAHHEHMMLLIDENKDTYIFTDPDEELYFGGTFQEMVKKVLLGIDYGKPIKKT